MIRDEWEVVSKRLTVPSDEVASLDAAILLPLVRVGGHVSVIPLFLGHWLFSCSFLGFGLSSRAAGLNLKGLGNWGSLGSVAGSVPVAHDLVEHLLLLRGGLALDVVV